MNLIYYIAASIVSHLLLIGFLYLIPPVTNAGPTVFKVDIVTPLQSRKPPEPVPVKPAAKHAEPPVVKQRPKPPVKELPPEDLYGRGTGDIERKSEKSLPVPGEREDAPSLSRPEGNGPGSAEKGPDIAPYSYLFDKNTIEKFAREGSSPQKGLTFDTTEFRHRGYMRMLKERIESIWQYPKEAARMGLSGDLYMKFTIKKDGRLGAVELLRTSGFKELDEAAIKAVKKAEPFWPLPDDWDKDDLEIRGHFIYIFGDTMVL